VKHWDFLKKKYGGYSLREAARDFSVKYGRNQNVFFRFLAALAGYLGRVFQK
jgi:DNA-directed RNA polymerase specialized sigma24 family protein